jgi:glutathione S-transferase
MMIGLSFASDGKQAFPVPIARYFAARYGYTPGCAEPARARVHQTLALLDEQLRTARASGHRYYLGEHLSALDVYSATALHLLSPMPDAQCPLHPPVRAMLECMKAMLQGVLPESMLEHRDMVYARHLALPIQF